MKITLRLISTALLLLAIDRLLSRANAQGTAFTYQGQLQNNGSPASGLYDFRFRLASDPLGDTYVGSAYLTNGVSVNNGLFIAVPDFGQGIYTGTNYWLEVDVRTNGGGSYNDLMPLQALTPAPYAVFANTASNLSGTISAGQLSGDVPSPNFGGTYGNAVTLNNSGNSFSGAYSGNGSGLTNLNAGQLTSGTLNLPSPEITFGGLVVFLSSAGSSSFFAGPGAGNAAADLGVYNTGVGVLALGQNTTGQANTANGSVALGQNTSGSGNTANGHSALAINATGNDNTADGENALEILGGSSGAGGTNNIAVGFNAGSAFANNESSNIDIGNVGVAGENKTIRIGTPGIQASAYIAGVINGNGGGLTNLNISQFTSGTLNLPSPEITLDGTLLLYCSTNLSANLSIGPGAGNGAADLAVSNTAVGANALASAQFGSGNTAVGVNALASDQYGSGNTADGAGALVADIAGNYNTANGYQALYSDTLGNSNTANGAEALARNISGGNNTANGVGALYYNTSGAYNTADGCSALQNLGSSTGAGGTNNIVLGYNAGSAFSANESSNIDIGNAGVSGENNTIRIGTPGIQGNAYIVGVINGNGGGLTNLNFGQFGGTLNLPTPEITGGGSVVFFYSAGLHDFFAGPGAGNAAADTGFDNTANGYQALFSNTSGSDNTALGYQALFYNTNGSGNTANGFTALFSNTSGGYNTAVGYQALASNTNGSGNVACGTFALVLNTSGSNNTAMGCNALANLGAGVTNIAVGFNSGSAFSANESYNIDIGNIGVPGESKIIRIGAPGLQTATYLAGTVYANGVALTSDRNAKEHFASIDSQAVLAKVAALPVSEWNYKDDKAAEHIGPMAQDFHAAFGLDGADDKHISVVDENGVALAAIQGLNKKLEILSTENEHLKQELDTLEAQVKALSERKQ